MKDILKILVIIPIITLISCSKKIEKVNLVRYESTYASWWIAEYSKTSIDYDGDLYLDSWEEQISDVEYTYVENGLVSSTSKVSNKFKCVAPKKYAGYSMSHLDRVINRYDFEAKAWVSDSIGKFEFSLTQDELYNLMNYEIGDSITIEKGYFGGTYLYFKNN